MEGLVQSGRDAFERRAWEPAFERLSRADAVSALALDDLERLATSAYLTGRVDDCVVAWQRAYVVCLRDHLVVRAARCAFWLAFVLTNHGEPARAAGWVHRARGLLERERPDCVELGYLDYCTALGRALSGDLVGAGDGFAAAARAGVRYASAELLALARIGEGRCRIAAGEISAGIAMLDEAMATITAHEVSPTAVGDAYCTVIEGCQEVFDVRRAQEWTEALNRWCESQPDLVLYRGQCLVHRAELMVLAGRWPEALREVEQACDRLSRPRNQPALGSAHYVRAELHRLQGHHEEALEAYRQARVWGREPQPGLALLRVAQGRVADADAAIGRCLEESGGDLAHRARLLGARVQISLVARDLVTARAAVDELGTAARELSSPYLHAVAAQASGAVLLAEGEPRAALAALRQAQERWVELEAPHDAARTRQLLAMACRAMGDQDSAELELDAARRQLAELGADPEVPAAGHPGGLTARELEVLRQLATGNTNRSIAASLFISEKTVASHVGSILRKLDVPSRAAATSYAHRHHLA